MSQVSDKIKLDHLRRQAYIYIRQSTWRQVRHHQESQRRQYALQDRAISLGWSSSALVVDDEDLGKSGTDESRRGFQRLMAATSRGEVGGIFCLEVSRLSRQSSAWYALTELCAWQNTLLIDEEGIYDPNCADDRLLLGIRGLMGETELQVLRQRMWVSKEEKAKRGALCFRPPVGLVHDPQGRLCLDPDEQVQGAVRLLFAQFRRLGSVAAVVRYFAQHQQQFPTRHFGGARDGELEWKPLTYSRAHRAIHNPLYAGAYAYGRRAYSRQRKPREKQSQSRVHMPQEAWTVLIWNAFPGYMSRQEYEANQRQLAANRPSQTSGGAARTGAALLSGLVLCGRCGGRMHVTYSGNGGQYVTYICRPWQQQGDHRQCQRVPGNKVEQSVVQAVLEALTPTEIALSLQVVDEIAQQRERLQRQWHRRLERAQYEADLARRRYQHVDPENRLVARTLEQAWEQKLQALAQLEHAYAQAQQETPLRLGAQTRERLLALARDLPALWHAESTIVAERKELLRLLIADVTLTRQSDHVLVQLRWVTNQVSTWTVPFAPRGARTAPEVIAQIRRLAPTHSDAQIADILNQEGWRTARGHMFIPSRVASLRRSHQIVKVQRAQ
jgi:DNA invertase Pin-like site-specific DNA recombinase